MKVESGLRLQLAGRVAEKVDVVAALNDQNTPIQPEGNSQTLQEIDKIFVEIKGKQFAATLGDYVFNLDTGEYGRYSRKLQGAMGTVRWRDTSVRFSAALSRGQYHTNKLAGTEGNQGPYQLRGAKGEANIIVIAGTERVWLDGEKLTRGENNDYVIEYGNGQLSFTAKRLITENSRIVVDFQYSGENYKREFIGGEVQSSFWQQRLKFSANFIHENDDNENPLAFTLTPENEQELQGAGDALDSTYISGAVFVGENKGAYVQRDSSGTVFYQYTGENKGNYRVSFTYVGFGNGDYQQHGFNKYHYVGPNAGSYQSRVQLEPAQSHSLVDFNLTFSPVKAFQIYSELALSRRDENTFSTMDDENNDGFAWRFKFDLKPDRFQKLGKVDLSGQFKYVNNDFSAIDRTTAAEYDRHWDLGELALVQEKVWELKGVYQPWRHLTLSGQVGDNQKGDSFTSSRYLWHLKLEQPAWPKLSVQNETIESYDRLAQRRGNWDRRNAELSYDFWKLRPFIKYSNEQKKNLFADSLFNTGIQFDSYAGGLVFSLAEKISVSAQLIHRKDNDFILQTFAPLTDAWTQQYLVDVARWKYVSSSVNFTHREIDYLTTGEHKQTDLAEWRLNFNLLKRALKGSGQYQLANTQVATQERQYLEVENGSGNYRYDSELHEYVPDAFGDYIVRVVPTRDFLPVTQIKASLNYSFDARRLIKLENNPRIKKLTPDSTKNMELDKVLSHSRDKHWIQTFGRQFSCDGLMRLEEKTRDTDLWQVYRMNPGHLQTDSTLLGTVFLRQTAHFGKNNPLIYVRLNFQQERTLNRQYVAGGENMLKIIRSIRMTSSPLDKLNLQFEVLSRRGRRRFDYAGRSSRDIRSREGNAEISYRLLKSLDFRL
ncbi:hypothetical protein KAH55_11035, partial [bacterium]|nr:hypothetical protein [bacterium]